MKPNERIWLQSDEEHGEPTWCEDKINDDDVEYIRADVYAQLKAEIERLREGLQHIINKHYPIMNDDDLVGMELVALLKGGE